MSSNNLNDRILVFASSRRDAQSTCKLFEAAGLSCVAVPDFGSLFAEIDRGAGVIIIAKEVLDRSSVQELKSHLDRQPRWSFLPLILLAGPGDLNKSSTAVMNLLHPLRNMTLLERPVRTSTLLSVVKAALADRQRQYELRDVLAELEISKSEAIAASEAKSSFLANMSHEIRTPLGAILGFSELLTTDGVAPEEKLTYTQTIRRNGQLLSALIDDVLDLAKVESGHLTIERIDVAVRELFSDVISAMQPRAFIKKVALSLTLAADVPWIVNTDPVRFKQILINVVGNAIKFTAQGEISVSVSSDASVLRILVSDTGIGITESQAQNLFSAFSQADSSITRRFGGTGLGLALSKKLAQALGGDLILKSSEKGRGSQFEISIARGQPLSTELVSSPSGTSQIATIKDLRILVVDDSVDNQTLIGHFLRLADASIETASDGIEAIERLGAQSFDVVLMDIQMPRLGGYEAVARLRQSGYRKPIVALTAHAFKEDHDRAIAAGFNDYLTKPIDRARLIETIARMSGVPRV